MKKGAVTVFFSLIILIVFSLICSMIESVRVQGINMQMESAAETGMISVFAGFNKELYEQYGLFFLDGSFGNSRFDTEVISEKLKDCMEYSLNPVKGTRLKHTDLYCIENLQPTIDKIVFATDDKGYVFRESAIRNSEKIFGIAAAEKLVSQYEWFENAKRQEQQYQKKEQEIQNNITMLEEEKAAVDLQNQEAADWAGQQENPTAAVEQTKSIGILKLVCNDQFHISQKSIHLDGLPTGRQLHQGIGLDHYKRDIVSDILFQSYILEKFTNALSMNEEKNTTDNLQYQLEYMMQIVI